jgi:hypothetical protein
MEKKYSITVIKDIGLIQARFFGKIEAKDMLDYLTDLYSMEDYNPIFPIIYDFRGCIAVGYRMEVIPFVKRLATLRSGLGKKKIGIVVDSLNQEFLVKAFIELATGLNLEIKMFEDPRECSQWILARIN